MSELLESLRQEQRHYEQSVYGDGRAETIDWFNSLEEKELKNAD